jgi:hypothetical protein
MSGAAMAITYDADNGPRGVRKIIAVWTSDSATGNTSGTTQKVYGRLVKAVTVPGTSGVQPSNNYSVVITENANGNNVLANADTSLASNQSNSAVQETYFFQKNAVPAGISVPPLVCDQLNIAVSGAGNSKQGTLALYFEQP